jgi:hypothetical protein
MMATLTRRQLRPGSPVASHPRVGPTCCLLIGLLLLAMCRLPADAASVGADSPTAGISYTNYLEPRVPWSIHVVRIDRRNSAIEFQSAHAGGGAVGLSPLSAQIRQLKPELGAPLAAINGDFYQRDRAYAGDPRGLQIVDGEVISAPAGGVCFWIDALGHPHATNVQSLFEVVWTNGAKPAFGLNGERQPNGLQLYTPSLGHSTHTQGGRELVLERMPGSPWLPLRMAETYTARVREVRDSGDTPLTADVMVLSVGPTLARTLVPLEAGAVVKIVTASSPTLWGAKTALGGGPVLVRGGRRQSIAQPAVESYEVTSMLERHPRTAIGWNQASLFLVEVDGRQRKLSVGMTLDELSAYLVRLGCQEAMNFDGGGSATLWYDGQVRNSPCDGGERPIANSLIIVRRGPGHPPAPASAPSGSK